MFYTPPSIFAPPTYPRKKQPVAGSAPEQTPRTQPDEPATREETRQPQLSWASPPQGRQSAPQSQPLIQQNPPPVRTPHRAEEQRGTQPGTFASRPDFNDPASAKTPEYTTESSPGDARPAPPAAAASRGAEAGAPGMPAAPLQPALPEAGQTDIAENLRLREQYSRQRQDQMLSQGAEQARQQAQQEPLLQPARQRLEAARQAHAALAGAPVRYETRDGRLVRIQSDASGAQTVLPVDPANTREMQQGAAWLRRQDAARAELTAAEAAHAPLAAGVQSLKDQHQNLAKKLVEDNRWTQSLQQYHQHNASGVEGPPPPFAPAPADRGLLARLQAQGHPLAAAVKEEMTPPAVRQLQEKLGKATPGTPMSVLDAVTGGTPGSGAKATPQDAAAARDLTRKTFGVSDPKNVTLTPQPDGTLALHWPRYGGTAPVAVYDPRQKSLTVQAENGTLSEGTRLMLQQLAVPPSRPGAKPPAEGMPVYFGNGPRIDEAGFAALLEAGKQAHETARTPEERAAAMEKLGLSPAGIKKQWESGTISLQQGLALNGIFNGVVEHNTTLAGVDGAMQDWTPDPNKGDLRPWLNEGTPEQRAYAINEYFKQTSPRAEGSLLATPERLDELRRRALAGINPEWGKPGAASPGSRPADGPPGVERIPLKGGGAAHIPSGTWTAHDYETLDQHPEIRSLPHAEREAAVDTLLSDYHDQLTSQPGFSAADQQKFHQTAQALRDRVAALKTWGDTAGEGVDLVKEAAKSEVGTPLAAGADLSIFNPDGSLRMPGKNLREQSTYEAQKVKDTAQRAAQPAAEKKMDAALEAIHQDIRNGSFPLAPGEAQDRWIDEISARLNPQRQQWFDAVQGPADPNTPEGKRYLRHLQEQTLASPENRALLQEYIRTGNKARWKELEHNLKKTPQRAQTEEDQQNSLQNDPLVRGLSDATGADVGRYMQEAPGAIAGHFVPGIDKFGRLGKLGKGSRMGRLGRRAAGIAAGIGGTVAQNTIENPDADFEDHKNAVIADYATSYGMKPLHHAAGVAGQKIKDHLPGRRPDAGSPGSAPPTSEGQTFEERLALEDGSMPLPRMDPAQPRQPGDATGQPPPASQQTIPDSTTPTAPGSEKQPQSTANKRQSPQTPASPPAAAVDLPQVGQVLDNIQRLKDKAKDGPLSLEEQRELDHNEKVLAQTRIKNLEKEQQVIRNLPQPRELDPVKAKALETERAILQRPVPGEPTAGGGAGEPVPVPSNSGEASPSPLPGNDGHGGGAPPPRSPPVPSESTPSKSSESSSTDATKNVAPPPLQSLDRKRHQEHREKYDRRRAEPRNPEAQATLKALDAQLQHPETGVDATRNRIETTTFDKAENIGGTHVNQADHLKSPDGVEVVHKPRDGQVKEKHRAGIEPETTGHREVAASKVAQALGIDLVPPTTMITHNGQPGSAQLFKGGEHVKNGKDAMKPPYSIEIDKKNRFPKSLPNDLAEDWQLTDDLLMHSDRHEGNYMLHLNGSKIAGASLVDNGYSLPNNTGVVEKRFLGPREGQPISPLNQERLHRLLDNEESIRKSLEDHLEKESIDGLFARAKALLARGTYGNFKIDEINAHLPPDKHRIESVPYEDKTK